MIGLRRKRLAMLAISSLFLLCIIPHLSLGQTPQKVIVDADIYHRPSPELGAFSIADVLKFAYPGLVVGKDKKEIEDSFIGHLEAEMGRILVLVKGKILATRPALVLLVNMVQESGHVQEWRPEILVVEERDGNLNMVAHESPEELVYEYRHDEDTGSRLGLSKLSLARDASAISVTLRESVGSDLFEEVVANTHLYLIKEKKLAQVLSLVTEQAQSQISYAEGGESESYGSMQKSFIAVASEESDGLFNLKVSTVEEREEKGKLYRSDPRVRTFYWNFSTGSYELSEMDK